MDQKIQRKCELELVVISYDKVELSLMWWCQCEATCDMQGKSTVDMFVYICVHSDEWPLRISTIPRLAVYLKASIYKWSRGKSSVLLPRHSSSSCRFYGSVLFLAFIGLAETQDVSVGSISFGEKDIEMTIGITRLQTMNESKNQAMNETITVAVRDPKLSRCLPGLSSPRPLSEPDAAAAKLQRIYKSLCGSRRNLADCAVVVEELWSVSTSATFCFWRICVGVLPIQEMSLMSLGWWQVEGIRFCVSEALLCVILQRWKTRNSSFPMGKGKN